MRRVLLILCLLANVSLVLMPLSTLHAHFDHEHHETEIHGGHQHGHETDASEVKADSVVDLQLTAFDRSIRTVDWTQWLPLLSVAVVLLLAPLFVASLRPPRPPDIPPLSRRSYWQPPLRGPPHSISTR